MREGIDSQDLEAFQVELLNIGWRRLEEDLILVIMLQAMAPAPAPSRGSSGERFPRPPPCHRVEPEGIPFGPNRFEDLELHPESSLLKPHAG
jgi:hypothetical protein